MKAPLPERIKTLEAANEKLLDKVKRMMAQIRHNNECIRKWQKRQATEQQHSDDVTATPDSEQRKRQEQSQRDKLRNKELRQAEYRRQMEKRLHDCRVMNGLEPDD